MVFGSGSQNRGASLAVHMLSCHSPRQGGGVSMGDAAELYSAQLCQGKPDSEFSPQLP